MQGVASSSWNTLQLVQRVSSYEVVMVYLQQFTYDGDYYMIEIKITSSHMRCHMETYDNLRFMVKTI